MIASGLHSNKASYMALKACWRHDVICNEATEFTRIFDYTANAGKPFEECSVELRRAARHEDLRQRILPVCAADCLAGLSNRLVGDGAAVDDDPILAPGRRPDDRLTLGEIEPAAKGDGLDAH